MKFFFGRRNEMQVFSGSRDHMLKKTLNISMEPKVMSRFGSDDFPFQTGDFQVPAVHVPGCRFPIFLGSATSVHPGGVNAPLRRACS